MSDEPTKKVAISLAQAEQAKQTDQFKEDLLGKIQGEKAARIAIVQAVKSWTGHEPGAHGSLPIVRDGIVVAWLGDRFSRELGANPIEVAASIWLEDTSALRRRRDDFLRLEKPLKQTLELLLGMPIEDRAQLFQSETTGQTADELEITIIKAIGSTKVLLASAQIVLAELRGAIERCNVALADRETRRGHPRVEARYRAAEGLAKIYAKVTGKRPTYSQDRNLLYGEFTPALRDLFDAMGWRDADLRAPAEAAIAAVTEEDLKAPLINRLVSLIDTLPPS